MLKKLTAVYALITTSCASWQTQRAPASRVVEESGTHGEQYIRVELNSGKRYDVYAATLAGDSLVGRNKPTTGPETERIAVATADIKSIARHKVSAGRTVLAVVAISAAVIALSGASGSSSTSSSTSNSSCAG
ncbi:MAG TPA: hypothetical protein VM076_23605 [Gemmatimonadaceae bacterium]|nr:hypothetical protein [Gemmatimonadaceae bacterium]